MWPGSTCTSTSGRLALILLCALVHVSASASDSDDPYVVTSLTSVTSSTPDVVSDQCASNNNGSLIGSVNLYVSSGKFYQLCQRRVHITAVQPDDPVLQRVYIFEIPYQARIAQCPDKGSTALFAWGTEYNASLLCAHFAKSRDTVPWHNYVSDLAITHERNYNNERPGWQTFRTNMQRRSGSSFWARIRTLLSASTPRTSGAFLSVRHPVTPIRKIRVLSDVHPDKVFTACPALYGPDWRQGGDGSLDQVSSTGKTVLCVQRSWSRPSHWRLLELTVVSTIAPCPKRFQHKQELTPALNLCSRFGNQSNESFIADVNLVRIGWLDAGADPLAPEFLPGQFERVSSNLNPPDRVLHATSAFLFVRRWNEQKKLQAPTPKSILAIPHKDSETQTTTLSLKILQLADLHFTGNPRQPCRQFAPDVPCTEARMQQWIADLLDVERPDMVVYTGDNVQTASAEYHQIAMDMATDPVVHKKIPFAMVFGNHDEEGGFSRGELIDIASHKPFSLTQRGPIEVPGAGNYEIAVKAPSDGPWGPKYSDVFRMYFLDSHSYPNKTAYPHVDCTYDWVRPQQIAYYQHLSKHHSENSSKVPSMMFFHIPLIEFADAANVRTSGNHTERISSSDVNTNLFSTLVDRDEVKVVAVGHDHLNEYCTKREGIQLCYGGGAGMGLAYGRADIARRARVFEWKFGNNGKRTIRSWKRHFGDMAVRKSEEILYNEL